MQSPASKHPARFCNCAGAKVAGLAKETAAKADRIKVLVNFIVKA
jgi:hypothetical protein